MKDYDNYYININAVDKDYNSIFDVEGLTIAQKKAVARMKLKIQGYLDATSEQIGKKIYKIEEFPFRCHFRIAWEPRIGMKLDRSIYNIATSGLLIARNQVFRNWDRGNEISRIFAILIFPEEVKPNNKQYE